MDHICKGEQRCVYVPIMLRISGFAVPKSSTLESVLEHSTAAEALSKGLGRGCRLQVLTADELHAACVAITSAEVFKKTNESLREIAECMDGVDWDADTLDSIRDILLSIGFEVNEREHDLT